MIQLAILSPLPALRAGLRALLSGDPDLTVTGAAASLDELAELLPEVTVLIVTTGGVDWPDLPLTSAQALLLVSGDPPAGTAASLAGLDLRAWGIIPPEATAETLQAAVRALAEGLIVAAPEVIQSALSSVGSGAANLLAESSLEDGVVDHLTEREGDVLRLLAQGLTNKQIALGLHISEHTVKFHVSSIYSKLGVSNRTEAVRKGARRGWVPL